MVSVEAIDNGKGITPPMGWRSWNLYGINVDQELIEGVMDAFAAKKREVDGVKKSLCDLGYCDIGLDDGWQLCGSYGQNNYTYHNPMGLPIVNEARFSDLKAMTNKAHSLNLTAGWYLNNCACKDHCGNNKDDGETDTKCYVGDVGALYEFGFDSVKLDGCGFQRDLTLWASLMNSTGRSIMIENCHWGGTVPNATWCPWNYYRTSGDIRANFGSVMSNLATTNQWAQKGLSKPGCWAYPDMLEVGCQHGPGGKSDPGLSEAETRTHFGAWCITSSPLFLSMDPRNDTVMDAVWPVISNPEALEVSKAWFGHSGSPFASSSKIVNLEIESLEYEMASWHFYYKPIDSKRTAVLLINADSNNQDLEFKFESVPNLACKKCKIRDVWNRKDIGVFQDSYKATGVESHDSAFLMISPA
eukprot:CAMPEP_0197516196 /NCGR_PEP_ID=MMETSP1318-20131121/1045_1 /TAXON_ID=552666 /ORGANISM="Partenskyella glossopodia, Strain RCC365" /LENGTH=414 /DNA_ID=CAMNT_0043064729 /DNA_START=57 /DNA_END=1301 /DNA_ORIENTATION=+